MIETGTIVKNLIQNESVEITKIQDLGSMVSLAFIGVNSKKSNNKVIPKSDFDQLEVVTQQGTYTFTGDPTKFTLYTEAERIRSAYQFDPLFAVNCSIVDPLPHQVEAVYKYLLPLPRIRFLLADDTGAGKTIMTGLLIKELMLRGLLERILIVTPGGLTKQWQEDELGLKFNLQFKLVNRATFNAEPYIFHQSNRLVTSIDFLRNEEVLNVAKETAWDMIVVDEAHKLSAYDYGNKRYRSKRYDAIENLALNTEHLLLLTATPHRGRKDTFRNLLQLLDQDIFSSDQVVSERILEHADDDTNKFFLRRLKEVMKDWDGKPLFKARHTKTVQYELTPEEKYLYDEVTKYLMNRREEAQAQNNIHVSLALMVMQRRLTSSIYAISNTLNNRFKALDGLIELVSQNPSLWKKRMEYDLEFNDYEDFDELDDNERESLEHILSDPRKFKLFTTAKSISEIKEERDQVKRLYDLAQGLYDRKQVEQKLQELYDFLKEEKIIEGKKLVIFTEHKDTLDYLEERLTNNGYHVDTIYGQKSVDERRRAQHDFAAHGHILIGTDAAGEGINLQFCNLMINWDIPWNPNRLEQRMGRIHRYGQKEEVYVFNMVAQNTREGKVMQRLLQKMEVIREQIGTDRVYDVISDIFEGVKLEDIINYTLYNEENEYASALDTKLEKHNVEQLIKKQKEHLTCSIIDYKDAKELKDHSDETRLQPIYIKRFFERSFDSFGGEIHTKEKDIYQLSKVPAEIKEDLRQSHNISADISHMSFCFDKDTFLDKKITGRYSKLYYINPGNPIFDSMVKLTISAYKDEVLKGAILVSPDEKDPYFAYFVRSQITDNRRAHHETVADEIMSLVCGKNGSYSRTSPAKLLDLHPPKDFVKAIENPEPMNDTEIVQWGFENITHPQFEKANLRIAEDITQRKHYLKYGFDQLIADITLELNELQGKLLLGDSKVEEKVAKLQERINMLQQRHAARITELDKRLQLHMKPPEILGCAFVVPLTQLEYRNHYGMSRDEDVEKVAMEVSMAYESENGWIPTDVSGDNVGYDIRSVDSNHFKRYIEVKGRAAEGGIMISENEKFRLTQLGNAAWLYVVVNCKHQPDLSRIQNPGNRLKCELKTKGVQYFVSIDEWKNKAE